LAFRKSGDVKTLSNRVKELDTQTGRKMNDVVWSVIIMLGIGLLGALYVIYYILKEASDELKMYQYKIKKIHKVIDGDTIDVDIDLGFHITVTHRIRLKDIDAAEIRTKDLQEKAEGLKAKEWLEKELSREGEWIIETYKEEKYGRMLGTLYLVGDPVTLNEKMLNEGIANPYI